MPIFEGAGRMVMVTCVWLSFGKALVFRGLLGRNFMSELQLCLHHELMLLVLDDSKGNFVGGMYHYGLAGAVLSELLLQGMLKVSNDEEKLVSVAMAKPTGDPLLDEVLQNISESKKPYDLKHWVYQIAISKELCHRIAMQLCELGILNFDESKVLWLFTKKRYAELDGSYEDAIRQRMADVMFTPGTKADERTAVLITFANSSGALTANFASVELKQHDARIKEICEGKQLATTATIETIQAVNTAMLAATVASTAAMTAATASG